MVTYRDGTSARRRSPIQVLTGPDVGWMLGGMGIQSWALTVVDQLTDEFIDRYQFSSRAETAGDVIPRGALS